MLRIYLPLAARSDEFTAAQNREQPSNHPYVELDIPATFEQHDLRPADDMPRDPQQVSMTIAQPHRQP